MGTQDKQPATGSVSLPRNRFGLAAGGCLVLAVLAAGGFWIIRSRSASPEQAPSPSLSDGPGLDPALLQGEAAFQVVKEFVALGARDSGTPGAQKAAAWLEERLRQAGLLTFTDEFQDQTPSGPMIFRNVVGIIERGGPGIIMLGSHYDTKAGISPDFAGANDSGSSTGLLLELARLLRHLPGTGPDIYVVFFDGEECRNSYGRNDGLHGSRYMVETLKRNNHARDVQALLLLDMVGDKDLSITIPRNVSPELATLVFQYAEEEGARKAFSLAGTAILDDHVPFLQAGIPSIVLIDFEFGSAPGRNDYWHTPEDTLDKLSPESLQTVGRVVIRAINHLLRNPGTPPPEK